VTKEDAEIIKTKEKKMNPATDWETLVNFNILKQKEEPNLTENISKNE